MKKIVVVGSLNVDLVVSAPALPREGQTVLGHFFRKFPGGKGQVNWLAWPDLERMLPIKDRVRHSSRLREAMDLLKELISVTVTPSSD